MQILVICVVLFFAAAELYQWLAKLTLSLPVLVAGGALLAIVSNRYRLSELRWSTLSKITSPPDAAIDVTAVPASDSPASTQVQ